MSTSFNSLEIDSNAGSQMRRTKSSPLLPEMERDGSSDDIRKPALRSNPSLSNLQENLEVLANVANQSFQNLPKPPQKVVSIWKAFRDFAFQGSVIDLAVGIILGGAFGNVVNSLVNDIIMPPIGWLLSGVDFANIFILLKRGKKNRITKATYKSLNQAKEDGAVTVNMGVFLNSVLNFVVISVIIFTFVRMISRVKTKTEVATMKKCEHCCSKIHWKAKKCAYCTSDLKVDQTVRIVEVEENDELEESEDGFKPKKYLKKNLKKQLSKTALMKL